MFPCNGMDQAEQMKNNSGNQWLVTCLFFFCLFDDLIEKTYYLFLDPDLYTGSCRIEKMICYQVISNISLKPDPVFIPAGAFVRFVPMPFIGKKDNDGPFPDCLAFAAFGFKDPFPPGDVNTRSEERRVGKKWVSTCR